MSDTDTNVTTLGYAGPAGIVFTPDDLLVIWSDLSRVPTAENADIRKRITRFLEGRKNA